MLEIILIVIISKKIATMLAEKGRSAAGYIVLFIFLWIGGEIIGAIVGTVITGFNFLAYVFFALLGAAIGGTIGYLIANSVPALDDPRKKALEEFDDEDDDRERERRRRRQEADEEKFEETDTDRERERRRRRQAADEGRFEETDR
jgi:membrane protein YqaA with SNARE-associated domain